MALPQAKPFVLCKKFSAWNLSFPFLKESESPVGEDEEAHEGDEGVVPAEDDQVELETKFKVKQKEYLLFSRVLPNSKEPPSYR